MPSRGADRLFDILRVLRAASRPVTAASFADELEVTGADGLSRYRHATGAAHPNRGRARDWLYIAARLRAAAERERYQKPGTGAVCLRRCQPGGASRWQATE